MHGERQKKEKVNINNGRYSWIFIDPHVNDGWFLNTPGTAGGPGGRKKQKKRPKSHLFFFKK